MVPSSLRKKKKKRKSNHTPAGSNKRETVVCSALIAPNFVFRNQPCKHETAPGAKDGSEAPVLQETFHLLKRGEKTPEVFDAKLAFQRQ